MEARGLNLENSKKLIKFEDVRQKVAEQHSLKNDDIVIEMAKVRVTPAIALEIPNLGTFTMTEWAKKQLGSALGIQWDKWFNPKVVNHEEVQEEIHRRFAKTGDVRKLRTSRFRSGAPGVQGCDGYIRALLGPTYHPIDDERVFDRLERKFGSRVQDFKFMKHLAKKDEWGTDHSTHYTMVGPQISLGAIDKNHSDENVRHWYNVAEREGKLPAEDFIYPGFHIRNSEVGYTAITIDEFSFRLVCLNGLMLTVGDARLMYRQHRPIEDAELDKQLDQVFARGPERWETTRTQLLGAQKKAVENPVEFIEAELKRLQAPKHFRDAAIKAFEKEPLPTVYGAVQAVTRAAQEYEDMDQRYDFEALAGRVLNRSVH